MEKYTNKKAILLLSTYRYPHYVRTSTGIKTKVRVILIQKKNDGQYIVRIYRCMFSVCADFIQNMFRQKYVLKLFFNKNQYRVAKTHRIPYLYRSFSAKEPYI